MGGSCGNLFPSVPSPTAALVSAIDSALGYTSWKNTPKEFYISSEQDMIDEGWLTAADARWPSGRYYTPDDSKVTLTQGFTYTKPIEFGIGSDVEGLSSGIILQYTGGSGLGPVDYSEDCLVFVKAGAQSLKNFLVLTTNSAMVAVSVETSDENSSISIDGFGIGSKKGWSVHGLGVTPVFSFVSSGINVIFIQDTPSTFSGFVAASRVVYIFEGFTNVSSGFFGTSGDFFDFRTLDIIDTAMGGTVEVIARNNPMDLITANDNLIVVTDDDTINNGVNSNNFLIDGSLGVIMNGIDNTSTNTTFSGNSFRNTQTGCSLSLTGNSLVTTNPGIGVYAISAGVPSFAATPTRISTPSSHRLTILDKNPKLANISYSASIQKIGGGSQDFAVGIFKNGSATPLSVVNTTIQGSREQSVARTVGIDYVVNDYFELKVSNLTSTQNWIEISSAVVLFLGYN